MKKSILVTLLVLCIAAVSIAKDKEPEAPTLTPEEKVSYLKLQREILQIQVQEAQLQQQYQRLDEQEKADTQKLQDLNVEANKKATAQYVFNPNTVEYEKTPEPPKGK